MIKHDIKSKRSVRFILATLVMAGILFQLTPGLVFGQTPKFKIEEATIETIQSAILKGELTSSEVVHLYLGRIRAYNGTCVNEPEGMLGPITTIKNAGKINALMTLNLRPDARIGWGFDARKARSMTDLVDNNPAMPDALEVAAQQDIFFKATGKLIGPLHGITFAIKDQYDTFDMRTTAGADAFYANDRPPDDATFVKRLRDAGAIILAKANMGEYAAGGVPGVRSSFGGTNCNAYDTERDPGASSGGSGNAVSANLVTCAIGEETGTSVREPAKNNSTVGLAPTRELVSADGMIQKGITTRVGPICRTVEDTARVLSVYAGFDPKDELTAFSSGRMPRRPYESYAKETRLDGMRIGVVREYMDKDLFTIADAETIDIIERAINDLRDLGATIVDPGPHGALFQKYVDKYSPVWRNQYFIGQFPDQFPVGGSHLPLLVDMFFDTSLVPHSASGQPNIRNLGPAGGDAGGAKYNFNTYLKERGDTNIQSVTDLINKANFWTDPIIQNRKSNLQNTDNALTLATSATLQNRFALQTVVLACFEDLDLDAVVYPTGNVPPAIITNPEEPSINDRGPGLWTFINSRGFPAMTVPAGFTTEVYDRVADASVPGGRRLVGPVPAKLPVGIDFLARPFDEPTLFKIGSAYEAKTKHRIPPAQFGPLP
ncbi:MAG: amidase [Acidobacteria bacterium]|nr:amidase [Acidobacteriota bacterium]